MNYRFENDYTYAEYKKWGLEIARILSSSGSRSQFISLALAIQFGIWGSISYYVLPLEVSFLVKSAILFSSFIGVGYFYESLIYPRLSAFLERGGENSLPDRFSSVIEVDELGIRTIERGREITFSWDVFHTVRDTTQNVIFIADTIHCVIPAKCFPGFLEKDAFVRECVDKIHGSTEQGAVFL